MKKLIEKFIKSLTEEGVLTKDQIEIFENFGADIQQVIDEECKKTKEEVEADKDEEVEEAVESVRRILSKVDEIHKRDLELTLCRYQEQAELTVAETAIVENISKYLDAVVEETLPESLIVDYAKLDRLTKLVGGIRESIIVTDEEVQTKISTTLEDIQGELDEKSTMLDEAIKRNIEFKSQLIKRTAESTLAEKLEDVPEFEAKKLKSHFAESTTEEINEEFDSVLSGIRADDYDQEIVIEKVETKEELQEEVVVSEIDRYAQLAERFYGEG